MSAEERESTYPDRLAELFRDWLERHARVAVRDAELDRLHLDLSKALEDRGGEARCAVSLHRELDRLSQENDRLCDELNRRRVDAERDVCTGCMERERQRDAWIEASRLNGVKAEEHKQAWHREHERAESTEAQLAEAREQLRLANIDALTNEADLAEAKKKIEDLSSSLARVREHAEQLAARAPDPPPAMVNGEATFATVNSVAAIWGEVDDRFLAGIGRSFLAILDNPPPGDTPERQPCGCDLHGWRCGANVGAMCCATCPTWPAGSWPYGDDASDTPEPNRSGT